MFQLSIRHVTSSKLVGNGELLAVYNLPEIDPKIDPKVSPNLR